MSYSMGVSWVRAILFGMAIVLSMAHSTEAQQTKPATIVPVITPTTPTATTPVIDPGKRLIPAPVPASPNTNPNPNPNLSPSPSPPTTTGKTPTLATPPPPVSVPGENPRSTDQ